jgi:hypothetical protein
VVYLMKTLDPSVIWSSGSGLAEMKAAGRSLQGLGPVVLLMPWLRRRAAQQAAKTMIARAGAPATVLALHDDLGTGPVALLNEATRLLEPQVEFLAYVAQDAFPGRYWLRFALVELARHPNAGLLAFNDGKWFGQLAGFGLVRRQWLAPLYGGLLFHPGYERHYGDTELTVVALQQNALAYHPHAMLMEVDAGKDARPVHEPDRQRFAQRASSGFDGLVIDPELARRFA